MNAIQVEVTTAEQFFSVYFAEYATEIRKTLQYANLCSAFYRELFASCGIDPTEVRRWEEFARIPPTLDKELRDRPLDFLIIPPREIAAVGCSSGTSGQLPKIVFAPAVSTKNTRRVTSEEKIGLNSGDHIAIIPYPTNIAPAVMPKKWQARGISSVVISPDAARHNPKVIFSLLRQSNVQAIRSVPNIMVNLTRLAAEIGFKPSSLGLKFITLTGSPLSANTRAYLEEMWETRVFGIWGANELGEIGVECKEHLGYHLDEEAFFVEAISNNLTRPVPPSQVGEALITKLRHRPIILVRYRLGDIIQFTDQPCNCGLTGRKVRVLGRLEEVVSVGKRPIFIYPFQIQEIISNYRELSGQYKLVIEERRGVDCLDLELFLLSSPAKPNKLEAQFLEHLTAGLELAEEVKLGHVSITVSLREVAASDKMLWDVKSQTVEDRRKR